MDPAQGCYPEHMQRNAVQLPIVSTVDQFLPAAHFEVPIIKDVVCVYNTLFGGKAVSSRGLDF